MSGYPPSTVRESVPSCATGCSWRYVLHRDRAGAIWRAVVQRYGSPEIRAAFRVVHLETAEFVLSAPLVGNPVTLMRKRRCSDATLDELHRLLECSQ